MKGWTTLRGREVVALGRELLGGNGVVTDFGVAKVSWGLHPGSIQCLACAQSLIDA